MQISDEATGGGLFLMVALIAIVYFVASSVFWLRRARWYRHEAQIERTRSYWAEARLKLFDLVRHDILRPDSATFRTFYFLQTEILRRPNEYEAISQFLQEGGLTSESSQQRPPWSQEQASWPREMSEVLHKMNQGIAAIAACYRPSGEKSRRLQQEAMSHRPSPVRLTHTRSNVLKIKVVFQEAKKETDRLERFAQGQPAFSVLNSGAAHRVWRPETAF